MTAKNQSSWASLRAALGDEDENGAGAAVPANVANDDFAPQCPHDVERLDVHPSLLADLAAKALSQDAECTTASIASRIQLGQVVAENLLKRLLAEKFIERKGVAPGLHNHQYGMLERGWAHVNQLMHHCGYIGPAPVSLAAYNEMIVSQVRSRRPVNPETLQRAVAGLILPAEIIQTLGLVASSGRSLFLSGPSGNGKTAMARALVDALDQTVWIPYAIEIEGHIVRVFDEHTHQRVEYKGDEYDRRWVKIQAPLVVAGGELTLDGLDLTRTDTARFYEAPFQMKSNGGVLLVDDLGRQRCSAKQLLNRWIIPLENRIDYLTLSTGQKIRVPFEQLVVFATNLTEPDLADEAFLRRMGYRLYVKNPTPEIYRQIFLRYVGYLDLAIEPHVLDALQARYETEQRVPKACEPRDLITTALDFCKFRRMPATLNQETLDVAWKSYFGGAPRVVAPKVDSAVEPDTVPAQ